MSALLLLITGCHSLMLIRLVLSTIFRKRHTKMMVLQAASVEL